MTEAKVLDTTDREISDIRMVNASRELLWKIWTEPEHIIQWWGPEGFSTTTETMDVRVGGEWNHVMHGPDGRDYINRIVYVDVVKPERLVYDHVSTPHHRTTVVFEEMGNGKTKLSFHMIFDTTEEKRYVGEKFKVESGLRETLGRMEEYLAEL